MSGACNVLIDVTRHAAVQLAEVDHIDLILLTHGHRDACGGMAALRRWWLAHLSAPRAPIPVLASPETISVVRRIYRRLDHCTFVPVADREERDERGLRITALEVPHAPEPSFRTYAWKIAAGGHAVVYASDVARLTARLARFARDASVLIIDGAMWRRRLFSHLTIDRALPRVCGWPVVRIVLTQIGRSAPPHDALTRAVRRLCPRARPAWDGMQVDV